jgi:hypothetical protein
MTTQVIHEEAQAAAIEPATTAGRGRLRNACHRIHRTVQEMNYASRRVVEVQAPWIVDAQWHRK